MLILQFLLIVVYYYMMAVSLAFLVRAVMSWIMPDSDNAFIRLADFMTEVFINPFRKLFSKFGWFQGSMLDIPFLAGSVLVWLLTVVIMLISDGIL